MKRSDDYVEEIHQKVSKSFPGARISKAQVRKILYVFNTYIFFILRSHTLTIYGDMIRAKYNLMKKAALKK